MIRAVVAALLVCALATIGRAEPQRTIAGSLQLDYLAVPTEARARKFTLDGATLELSLKMSVDFSKHASASVKACFACHGFEAASAFVDLRVADELTVRIGRLTPSFGNFPQRHDPANHRTSDKPLPYDMGRMLRRDDWNEGVLPAPWVDNGIEVGGTRFMERGRLDYAVYALSGPKAEAEPVDFDFILSRQAYYVDNNSQPILGARLAGALDLDDAGGTLEAGGSVMAGTYDAAADLRFWIAGIDVVAKIADVALRAEYLRRETQMALGADPATRFKFGPGRDGFDDTFVKHGYYVEGEVALGRVDLIARFDGLRRYGNVLAASSLSDHASVSRYTAAAAIRFSSDVRLKTSVEYYRFSDFANELALHLGVATPF